MFLKEIVLKNFKCHKEFKTSFEKGIISIYGENGAGKSSILEAISWVLFNFTPYSNIKKLIKYGSKNAEVELHIESSIDNKIYIIIRNTSGAVVVYDKEKNSLILSGVLKLEEWVRAQLKLDKNIKLNSICQNAVAPPQGQLISDFIRSPQERKKIFDQILNLDCYKLIDEKLRDTQKVLENEKNIITGSLSHSSKTDEEIESLSSELQKKNIELQSLETELILFKDKLLFVSEEVEKIKRNKILFENKSFELNKINIEINELKEIIKKLEIEKQEKLELDESAKLYDLNKNKKKEFTLYKQEFDNLKIKENEFIKNKEFIERDIENIKVELQRLGNREVELEEIKPKLLEFENLKNTYEKLDKEIIEIQFKINSKEKYFLDKASLVARQIEIEKNLVFIEEKRARVLKINELENELIKLREVCQTAKNLEKEKNIIKDNKLFEEEDINKLQFETKELKTLETELMAQIKFADEILPELKKTAFCPLFGKECKNLKENNTFSGAWDVLTSELRNKLSVTKEKLEKNEINIKLNEKLKNININLNELLGENTIEILIQEGIKLKELLEEIKQDQVLVSKENDYKKELNDIKNKLIDLEINLKDIENKEILIKDLIQQLEISKLRINELKEYDDKAKIIKSELLKLKILNENNEILNKRLKAIIEDLENIKQSKNKYLNIEVDLAEINNILEKLEPIYNRWHQLLESENSLNLNIKKYNKFEIEKKECEEILVKLDPESFTEEKIQIQTQEKEALNKEVNEKEALFLSIKHIIEEKNKDFKNLLKEQEVFKNQKKAFEDLSNKIMKINKMREMFKQMSLKMALYYNTEISNKASKIFSEIIGNSSVELKLSETYEIIMINSGQEFSFDVLSGGQQVSAALSIRLAMLQELANIDFAFFDEPTVHLDEERRNQLALQLSQIKSFKQLFVITHDESFASFATQPININN